MKKKLKFEPVWGGRVRENHSGGCEKGNVPMMLARKIKTFGKEEGNVKKGGRKARVEKSEAKRRKQRIGN